MSADQFDAETHFFQIYDIITPDEQTKLNNDRERLDRKMTLGFASSREILKHIRVELNLLDTCRMKINQKIEENTGKYISTELISILSNHINNIYHNMFVLFPVETIPLSEYIKFWSINKLYIKKSRSTFPNLMLRYHSNPEVYITGATYAFDDRNDIETAKRYIAQGLKHHNNCKSLYIEEFWIEVKHADKTAGASLPIAIKSYRKLIKRFKGDMELHFILLDRVIQLSTITELQSKVVRDMVKKYKHSEFMWEKLAKIHFNGFIYNHMTKRLYYDRNYINGIRNCIKTYEDGLKGNLPSTNKQNLWNFYIDHVIDVRKSFRMQDEVIKNFMNETMERAFREAHDRNALRKAEYYIYWAENNKEDAYKILKDSVSVIKDSVELWTKLISYCINIKKVDMAIEVLRTGVHFLNDDSLPLWKMIISYMKNTGSELLQQLYEYGAPLHYEKVNTYVKSNYLEWCFSKNGILPTRELFEKLRRINPKCKNLYEIMIQYEIYQDKTTINLEAIRILYNNLCYAYGKQEIGVWIDYMRFEYIYGNKLLATKIYEKSLSLMKPQLRFVMIQEFKKLYIEFKNPEDQTVVVIDD